MGLEHRTLRTHLALRCLAGSPSRVSFVAYPHHGRSLRQALGSGMACLCTSRLWLWLEHLGSSSWHIPQREPLGPLPALDGGIFGGQGWEAIGPWLVVEPGLPLWKDEGTESQGAQEVLKVCRSVNFMPKTKGIQNQGQGHPLIVHHVPTNQEEARPYKLVGQSTHGLLRWPPSLSTLLRSLLKPTTKGGQMAWFPPRLQQKWAHRLLWCKKNQKHLGCFVSLSAPSLLNQAFKCWPLACHCLAAKLFRNLLDHMLINSLWILTFTQGQLRPAFAIWGPWCFFCFLLTCRQRGDSAGITSDSREALELELDPSPWPTWPFLIHVGLHQSQLPTWRRVLTGTALVPKDLAVLGEGGRETSGVHSGSVVCISSLLLQGGQDPLNKPRSWVVK
jgi:hypothetical protein